MNQALFRSVAVLQRKRTAPPFTRASNSSSSMGNGQSNVAMKAVFAALLGAPGASLPATRALVKLAARR